MDKYIYDFTSRWSIYNVIYEMIEMGIKSCLGYALIDKQNVNSCGFSQSSPWVGLTLGLVWALLRFFLVFGGLGWVVFAKVLYV